MSDPGREDWRDLADDLAHSAILTDFDGTLAQVVDDPAAALPLPGAAAILDRLAERAHTVAIISGRPLSFLIAHFGPHITLAGLYGLEIRRDGEVTRPDEVEVWRTVVTETAARARAELPPQIRIEPKGLAITLHYREAPGLRRTVETWAQRRARTSGLRLAEARCSVELNPPLAVDKGTVVAGLADAPGVRHACYLGDDHADVAAFEALDRLRAKGIATHTIAVRGSETPDTVVAAAERTVDGPAQALALLASLAQPTAES